MGNATIDGGGGTNIVQFHGSYGDYKITKVSNGYWVADKTPNRDGTVFITQIQKLNFVDIQAVDLSLPNALPVADTLSKDSVGNTFDHSAQTHLISAAQLLVNDQTLNSSGGLHISSVSDAVGGTVSLTQAGDVQFTPNPLFSGIMSFKYTVADAQGHAAGLVLDLNTNQSAPMRAKVTLATANLPTDPLIAKEWYLNDANILPVWNDYTGKGVRIGQFEPEGQFAVGPEVLDYKHPDLAPNIDPTWLASQKAAGTLPTNFSNHATMVAGIMVADKNGTGAVGVAYDATIGGYYLAGDGNDLSGLGRMVSYDIANNSWNFQPDFALSNLGGTNTARVLLINAQYAADNGRGGLGTILVEAGGNERTTGGSAQGSLTNNNRFSIEVGAINQQGDLSTLTATQNPFSNPGASILVSAPGSNMTSTSQLVVTDQGSIFGDSTSTMQGTSFATPIVSGLVALMLEANPNLGYRDVQEILALSAHKIIDNNTVWSDNHATHWNGGAMHTSNDYGFGEVDALAAVRLAETWLVQKTGNNEAFFSASTNTVATVNAGNTATSTLVVSSGLQVEHAEVDLNLGFGHLNDLTVKLISPNGTQNLLLSGNDPSSTLTSLQYTFMTTHDWGEQSAGNWTLQVTDAATGAPVNINGWALRLYGSPTSADDTYFYTNEYASQVASNSARAILNDATNGIAGGINTINAAAVTGNTTINLVTGSANIGGTNLTIQNPGNFNNLISGDGNDSLTANNNRALLDGGRGNNTLTGGSGQDLFVVHQRVNGQDTIVGFNTTNGETIDLVGFTNLSFSNLSLTQQGNDVLVGNLGASQTILLKNTTVSALNASKFSFQDTFVAPSAYTTSGSTNSDVPAGMSIITLHGGGETVGITFSGGTSHAQLSGTVYHHDSATSDDFLIAPQEAPTNNTYHNALQGFKHGIDKIDVSQLGITSFGDLTIKPVTLYSDSGVPVIHGIQVFSASLGSKGVPMDLVYLDAVDDPSQVTASDFIFAPGASGTVTTPPPSTPTAPNNIVTPSGGIDPSLIGSNNGVTNSADGTTVISSVDYVLPNTINKLVLAGSNDLVGTANNNGDTITSNTGQDTMIGGLGNDTYIVNNSDDVIVENPGNGTDLVQASVSYALNDNVENLTLTGTGDIDGTGNALNNVITGNSGANVLDGSTGNDTMIGGLGNDTYLVDSTGDSITENPNAGIDTVQSSISYTLTNVNLENLILTGTVALNGMGNSGDNFLTGNSAANSLSGGAGNDTLAGNGGNDTLDGGLGNDTYQFLPNYGTDTINDAGGSDTLDFSLFTTSVSVSLGTNVINGDPGNSISWTNTPNAMDNLTTGSGNDTLNGSSLANVLNGNDGYDTLIGLGGNDTMNGGAGDDSYLFADGFGADSITDANGNDTLDLSLVNSAITYNATTGSLTSGANSIAFTPGTTSFEKVIGGNGSDIFTAGSLAETFVGGAGNDTFNDGGGNDTYLYANNWGSDLINESTGIDTVDLSAVTTNLNVNMASGSGNEVSDTTNLINWTGAIENITTGSGIDTINGTSGDNYITSGVGSDAIWAALGNDTIDGGDGNDRYVYTGAWGNDSIIDSSGNDTLDFTSTSLNVTFNLTSSDSDEVTDGTDTINWSWDVIETVKAGTGNDIINGNSFANLLSGNAGNDSLNGGFGNDTLDGGAGNDLYTFINGFGIDSVSDSGGNDTFLYHLSHQRADNIQ